ASRAHTQHPAYTGTPTGSYLAAHTTRSSSGPRRTLAHAVPHPRAADRLGPAPHRRPRHRGAPHAARDDEDHQLARRVRCRLPRARSPGFARDARHRYRRRSHPHRRAFARGRRPPSSRFLRPQRRRSPHPAEGRRNPHHAHFGRARNGRRGHPMSGSSNKGWWHQPATVWAVAFAATVSFMGIGLVDPILPAIAEELHASAAQTSLLFTSYLLITAIAMFFSSWVSGRLGAKNTLLLGLALIVVFALASGLSPSVPWIIAFRAVWGLGNALFLSTALATIISEAREAEGAIILYEAALGVGMALGPRVGGPLGRPP